MVARNPIVTWGSCLLIAGSENDSNVFTKNLEGPLFERFTYVYAGKDECSPNTE